MSFVSDEEAGQIREALDLGVFGEKKKGIENDARHAIEYLLDTREAVIAKIKEIQEEARNVDDGITLTVCEDILDFIRNPKEAK